MRTLTLDRSRELDKVVIQTRRTVREVLRHLGGHFPAVPWPRFCATPCKIH
jgi:hypothetical protein